MTVAPRQSDTPKAGFYLLRLTRGGPWVGASIAFNEADGWSAMINGVNQGPSKEPWLLPFVEQIHFYGRETNEAEVKYRIGFKRWAEIYDPTAPAANPKTPINIDKLIPF